MQPNVEVNSIETIFKIVSHAPKPISVYEIQKARLTNWKTIQNCLKILEKQGRIRRIEMLGGKSFFEVVENAR